MGLWSTQIIFSDDKVIDREDSNFYKYYWHDLSKGPKKFSSERRHIYNVFKKCLLPNSNNHVVIPYFT